MKNEIEITWEAYRARELELLTPLLIQLGYRIDPTQQHILGERFLMMGTRDIGGGGFKLVLTGTRVEDGVRVIIKASCDPAGIEEIEKERRARNTITKLRFSYHSFLAPKELLYTKKSNYLISITEYIAQDMNFISRSNEEQFALSLKAFKIQEGAHATTHAHSQAIRSAFGSYESGDYIRSFNIFREHKALSLCSRTARLLQDASLFLKVHAKTIDQYGGFLTHTDFVPHNLRIHDGEIYLLDYASIHFGNKYESWGRFVNFMMLYNPTLEVALVDYVRNNRTVEERSALKLMRIYKLGYLLSFHATNIERTSGDLRKLTENRLSFWGNALESILEDRQLKIEVIEAYKKMRDGLRSDEEKHRQKELH